MDSKYSFKLPKSFVRGYADKKAPFGFNGLGEVTYRRSYSRLKEDMTNEEWYETIERVVNGTYTMMHEAASKNENSPWIEDKAVASAKIMYDKMFNMKFLPPGRGLYAMGSKITEQLRLYASLNNCAFVSTDVLHEEGYDRTKPFHFLMLMSMMGVGVGFDVKGRGSFVIRNPTKDPKTGNVYEDLEEHSDYIEIEDSREGWVDSTMRLLRAYFYEGEKNPIFSYKNIREKGSTLKTFGGIAPGPEPLIKLHDSLKTLLREKEGKKIDTNLITDIMNQIGACVVAGGVRRTAEIALGDMDDEEFIHLKDFGTYRSSWMWTSNNSVNLPKIGKESQFIRKVLPLTVRTVSNGEPGYYWMDNMKGFGRMHRSGDYHNDNPEDTMIIFDKREEPLAKGTNPCAEQTLESYELCCLVETFPHLHDSIEEFIQTLKYAYLYAKVVTTGMTQWEETNEIIQRNRRVGCSMTGISQFVDFWGRKKLSEEMMNESSKYESILNRKVQEVINQKGLDELIIWCEEGYRAIRNWDVTYSNWMGIPESVKVTSIKPSGTVSLLGGATPGMHWPIEKYYKRRIRINENSPLISVLIAAGYDIEKDCYADNTQVVTFPVYCGSESIPIESEVSMEDQINMAYLLQKHWSDNQVSVTIKFWKMPNISQASKSLDLLNVSFSAFNEELLNVIRSRKVFDFSGEEGLQESLDKRWDNINPKKLHEMICIISVKLWEVKISLSERIIDDGDVVNMNSDRAKDQINRMKQIIRYQLEVFFSVETEKDEERIHEERVMDILLLCKAVHIASLLFKYQNKLKSISFLPMETGVYAQAPYERIDKEQYQQMLKDIKHIEHWNTMVNPEQPIGCDGDSCENPKESRDLSHSSS